MSQEAWSSAGSRHDHDDTSDRLYTPEDLAAYAARRDGRAAGAAGSRGSSVPVDPLTDPLTGPLTGPIPDAASSPTPSSPPPSTPPPAYRPPTAAPAGPPPATLPATPPATPPPSAPPAGHAAPVSGVEIVPEPDPEGEVRRFMTATDFLDRRDASQEHGPATWGWRGAVRRWSGGLITPRMGPAEVAYERDRQAIQKDFDGPRTIAFINPKGGAAKTTGVLAAGYTFGTVRGGGVVAWDNNETRGTLGIRGTRSTHRNTTRELLEDLERFTDVYQSRIGDLGAFVRSQGDAHFDVLASDERPDVTGTIRAQDFDAVHKLLERFYRIILIDTGNNMRAENWLAAAGAADLLVVTSTVREDTGYSGLWMLDALQDAGYQNLKYKAITVLSDPSATVDTKLAADLVDVYQQRTRAVYRVPYDPALVAGSVVPYAQLSENTKMQWLKACAGMAAAL
jgi:MinD-like ATPase involved in chromosome partitioning or flagellar assembly